MGRPPSTMLRLSSETFRIDKPAKENIGKAHTVRDFARRYGSESSTLKIKAVTMATVEDALTGFEFEMEPTDGTPGNYAFLDSIHRTREHHPHVYLAYWLHLYRGEWWAAFQVIELLEKED